MWGFVHDGSYKVSGEPGWLDFYERCCSLGSERRGFPRGEMD